MLGLPHTRTTNGFSHCAFTGKIRRWGPMMAPFGYECIHYGVGAEGPDTPGWAGHVEVMTIKQQTELAGMTIEEGHVPMHLANIGHPLYRAFNQRLKTLLGQWVKPGDVVCLPMGKAHAEAVQHLLPLTVETGIGYPDWISGYRIYESEAWRHWHIGVEKRHPWISEWVVPNYFDVLEWDLRPQPAGVGDYFLFMGRQTAQKGMNEIEALADALPEETFLVCGQNTENIGWKGRPNIRYRTPAIGRARSGLIGRAKAVLMPSQMLEPFGGVAVEAMLTGTPVLTTPFGAFTETVPAKWRCRTLGDWLRAIAKLGEEVPSAIRAYAQQKFGLGPVGAQYHQIFQELPGLRTHGFYAR